MTTNTPTMPAELAELIARHAVEFAGFRMMADEDSGGDTPDDNTPDDDHDDDGPTEATDAEGNKLGFPANTRVSEMKTDAERAAYYKHQSRRHEKRSKQNADEVARLRRELAEARGDDENDDEDDTPKPKARGRQKRRADAPDDDQRAFDKYGRGAVKAEFRAQFKGERTNDEIDTILEGRDLRQFIDTDSGDVDTDKVMRLVDATLAPSKRGNGEGRNNGPDMGQGRRGTGTPSKAAQGRAEAAKRFGTKS